MGDTDLHITPDPSMTINTSPISSNHNFIMIQKNLK